MRRSLSAKVGVAQPVAEGEERLAAEVAVGAPLHAIVLEGRQVVHRPVEGDRQPPAGVVVAEEHVGQRLAAGLARIPGLDDGRDVLGGPVDGQGAAVEQHQHQRLAQRLRAA